jgi:hypothetical protein
MSLIEGVQQRWHTVRVHGIELGRDLQPSRPFVCRTAGFRP